MPGLTYTILSAGETMVAGLMALPEDACAAGARPAWIGYVGADDVDAAADAVASAGGAVALSRRERWGWRPLGGSLGEARIVASSARVRGSS